MSERDYLGDFERGICVIDICWLVDWVGCLTRFIIVGKI